VCVLEVSRVQVGGEVVEGDVGEVSGCGFDGAEAESGAGVCGGGG
jgi:hypothetical protein